MNWQKEKTNPWESITLCKHNSQKLHVICIHFKSHDHLLEKLISDEGKQKIEGMILIFPYDVRKYLLE
jgi:hypothetical protein